MGFLILALGIASAPAPDDEISMERGCVSAKALWMAWDGELDLRNGAGFEVALRIGPTTLSDEEGWKIRSDGVFPRAYWHWSIGAGARYIPFVAEATGRNGSARGLFIPFGAEYVAPNGLGVGATLSVGVTYFDENGARRKLGQCYTVSFPELSWRIGTSVKIAAAPFVELDKTGLHDDHQRWVRSVAATLSLGFEF